VSGYPDSQWIAIDNAINCLHHMATALNPSFHTDCRECRVTCKVGHACSAATTSQHLIFRQILPSSRGADVISAGMVSLGQLWSPDETPSGPRFREPGNGQTLR